MFEKFGEIESVHIPKGSEDQGKDFGYVSFKSSESAEQAVNEMDKKLIEEGKFLIVNRHYTKKENELLGTQSKLGPISQNLTKTFNSNVFVKFIPSDMSEDKIREVFQEAGSIISMKINQSKKKTDEGEICIYQYGYILFQQVSEAQNAIKKFDNSDVFGGRPIKVDLWMSKDEIQQEKTEKTQRELKQIIDLISNPGGDQRGMYP